MTRFKKKEQPDWDYLSPDREWFIAAEWPDYTAEHSLAMRHELPPMPETMEDRQERIRWITLALRQLDDEKRRRREDMEAREARRSGRQTIRDRIVHEAGSERAIETVRRLTRRDS